MCAINGASGIKEALVREMNEATKHRGPDGSLVRLGAAYTLGHNRLAVIDVHKRSDQPMASPDGRYVIVFNGEIYNFRELRKELKHKHHFVTDGDAEVLLVAYSVWGEAMLSRLRGMFAFAIIDNEHDEVFLVRDQIGIKPLYYSLEGGGIIFSSELKGMIAAGFNTIDKISANIFLSMQYVPSPRTLIKNVSKLQPGQFLRYKINGSYELSSYGPSFLDKNYSIAKKTTTYDVINTAVKSQLVSDRPIGLFLSGGLDSSIILHHTKEYVPNIRTFSMDFELEDPSVESQAKFNFDAIAAIKTAKHYGVPHTTFTIGSEEITSELELAFSHLDEPIANPTSLSRFLLSKKVRDEGIVVALGGDGGDEVFKGYVRYRAALATEYFQRLPKNLQSLLGSFDRRLKKMTVPLGPEYHSRQVFNQKKILQYVTNFNEDASAVITKMFNCRYGQLPQDTAPSDAFMAADAYTWLPDESLHSTDRATMAHALEYRVPLLDQVVIAHGKSLKRSDNISLLTGKKHLRTVYRHKLPDHLFNEKKRGWFSPAAKWLRNESVNNVVKEIMSDDYYDGLSSMINWRNANDLLDKHIEGSMYATNPLWNIMQLQVWARHNKITL